MWFLTVRLLDLTPCFILCVSGFWAALSWLRLAHCSPWFRCSARYFPCREVSFAASFFFCRVAVFPCGSSSIPCAGSSLSLGVSTCCPVRFLLIPNQCAYEVLSYSVFMLKLSTHPIHDTGLIILRLWPKVFTDNQMSWIKDNYYICSVSKDYDDSQRNETVEDSIIPQDRQLGQHVA
jgi:hypothetical protein